ncbi:MAG: trypsin-like peptidase domain-containing protein [Patescibacteria group bacterium]
MKKIFGINISLILFVACILLASNASASTNTYLVSSDNIIDSGKASEYQKCSTYGDIGSWSSYGGHSFRYLAKINLTGLSSASQFDKAVFKMDRVSNSWDDDDNYVLYKVTSSWNENSVTWNSQPTYSSTGIKAQVVSQGVYKYEFDVTSIVKEWLSNPSTNYGFVIRKEVENTSLASHKGLFACANYSTSGSEGVPILEISSGVSVQNSSNSSSTISVISSSNSGAASLSSLPKADVYRAIAKVMTIGVNQDQGLMETSYGSGVIISPDGLLLTNSHVVTVDDNYDGADEVAGYNICLNSAIDKEPDCNYKAKLIAKDEKLDIALLKIESIPGLSSLTVFPYINFSTTSSNTNDEVVALGFPAIGGDTITVTKGIISGKLNKYSHDWMKTDAVISFGSSGGAAINMKGELVGITSGAYSDLISDMGYIINIDSLKSWIDFNKTRSISAEDPLLSSLNNFILKKKQANTSNIFKMDKVNLSITRPSSWEFIYDSEESLYITERANDAGGSISIGLTKYPYAVGQASLYYALSQLYDLGIVSGVDIISNSIETINGVPVRNVKASLQGKSINFYFLSNGPYLISVGYDYGENSQDKSLVDAAIKSITLGHSIAVPNSQYSYKNPTYGFSLNTSGNWVIMPKYIGNEPLTVYNKSNNTKVSVKVNKETEDIKNLSDELILSQLKTAVTSLNKLSDSANTKINVVKSSINNKINSQLDKVILVESSFQKISTGEVVVREISYTIRKNDNLYIFSLNTLGLNDKDYAAAVGEFNNMLKGFYWGVGNPSLAQTISSKNDTNAPAVNAAAAKNSPAGAKEDLKLTKKLSGKILLQVEDGGKAWYVDSKSLNRYYLADGNAAYGALKKFGLGITNENLNKIPVGIEDRVLGVDSDNDGLDDKTEISLGTDKNKADTDGDGYHDSQEVKTGYNPRGAGKTNTSSAYSKGLEGKILIQVQGNGEAWYVYNGKRYYLADGEAAYKIMKYLSLGITTADLNKIKEGK